MRVIEVFFSLDLFSFKYVRGVGIWEDPGKFKARSILLYIRKVEKDGKSKAELKNASTFRFMSLASRLSHFQVGGGQRRRQ